MQEKDSLLFERLLSYQSVSPELVDIYAKIFSVLMHIELLQKFKVVLSPKELTFEQLP